MGISEWIAKKKEAFRKFQENRAIAQRESEKRKLVEDKLALARKYNENARLKERADFSKKELKALKTEEKYKKQIDAVKKYKSKKASSYASTASGVNRGIGMIGGNSGVISIGGGSSPSNNDFFGGNIIPPFGGGSSSKKKSSNGGGSMFGGGDMFASMPKYGGGKRKKSSNPWGFDI